MQIMPTTNSASVISDNLFANYDSYGESDNSFAAELARQQEARDAVNNGEAHSVQSALDDTSSVTPLAQAPYNLTSNNGVTYTTEEVVFTKEELQQLERDLKENGAPIASINEINKLSQQPGGSTLGEVMAAVNTFRQYPTLNSKEEEALKGLANKIDPGGSLYNTISGYLADGNGKGALDALVQGMQGSGVQFSRDDILVLSKALGLSDTTTHELMGQFGNSNSITLNKAGLASFLTPAYNDFASEVADREKATKALDASLGEILQTAKDRMAAEKAASELSSRKTEQSKVVIEKTVLENVNNNLEGARASQNNPEALTTENGKNAFLEGRGEKTALETANNKSSQDAQNLSLEQKILAAKDADMTQNQGKNARDNSNESQDSKKDAWSQIFAKTDARAESSVDARAVGVSANAITTPVLGIGGFTQLQNITQQALNKAQAGREVLSQRAAAQVEQALLTAAKDGSKSLELQLHPAELGSLTITLTARNGEVSAMIRSEKTETAEMLNKQLDQLRTQLENQGIKIDKLEVRNGSQENASTYDTWQGTDQHNAQQEENAQREMLERIRNLARVRNSNENLDTATLERNMHNERYTAENAAQSLYIVA